MGTRADTLAAEFEQAGEDFARAIEACTDADWSRVCNAEGWTVAQTAQHLSGGFPLEMEYVTAAAEGRPLPAYTWDEINRLNEDRATCNANADKSNVLSELRAGMQATSAYIRALTDEQLDCGGNLVLADGAVVTTQYLIESVVLTAHLRGHLQSILAARS